jgi:hypothetical protein
MTSSAFSRQVNTVDRVSAHRVTPITRVAAGDLVTDNGAGIRPGCDVQLFSRHSPRAPPTEHGVREPWVGHPRDRER